MATLKEAINFAKQNPTSDYAKELERRIKSGSLNEQAYKEGLDFSTFGGQKPGAKVLENLPSANPGIIDYAKSFLKTGADIIKGTVAEDIEATKMAEEHAKELYAKGNNGEPMTIAKNVGEYTLGLGEAGLRAVFAPLTAIIGKSLEAVPESTKNELSKGIEQIKNSDNPDIVKLRETTGLIQSKWNELSPEAQDNLSHVLNIGLALVGEKPTAIAGKEIVTGVKGGTQALKTGAKEVIGGAKATAIATPGIMQNIKSGTEKIVSNLKSKVSAKSLTKESENTWKMIQPELTAKESAEAVASSQVGKKGFKTVLNPTDYDKKMIEVAQPYVSTAKNELEAVANMKQGIKDSAQKVRTGLEKSEAIWNKNELKGIIDTIEIPITVKSDVTLNNTFKNLKKAVLKLADEADKKTVGILDVRQKFDDLIEKEFGSAIYDKNNPMSNVIKQYRNKLNDFIEAKIPEGRLPDGSSFKGELKKQTLLYNAIDNTAPKVGKIGTSDIESWMKKNPGKAGLVKWLVGGIGATGAFKVLTGD